MNRKITLILLVVLMSVFMAGLATASQDSLGIFKQHECVEILQMCATCSYNNITSIQAPNSTLLNGVNMSQNGVQFNYTFCQANDTGIYSVNGHGDIDGIDEIWVYDFTITENGRPEPEGEVIVIFGIAFFLLIGWWAFELKNNMSTLGEKETTLKQVITSNMVFLGVVIYRYLCEFFFPKELIMEILLRFMEISAFTHVLLPIVGFVITILTYYRKQKHYGNEE